mgnify:FL=1
MAGSLTRPTARPMAEPEGALTCYLVEDNPLIRENLVATLEEMSGVRFLGCAPDEHTAVDWVRRHTDARCDLMIIDLFLASGSGLEVLRQVRPLRPQAHLVVLTNYATADMRRRCAQLGADRVFDKSAELDELIAYVDGIGGGSHATH